MVLQKDWEKDVDIGHKSATQRTKKTQKDTKDNEATLI